MDGLRNGFSLVDCNPADIPPAYTPNHPSALTPKNRARVEAWIRAEIEDRNYFITPDQPRIVSALAAIDKPDGDIRLIHDFSRPAGASVNDYATKDACRYTTLSDALDCCKPQSYLATLDIRWAYRSISIRPSERCLTGLQWKFQSHRHRTFLADCSLAFGSRKAQSIFNRVTQAIQRMMDRRGYQVKAYLDDFIVLADDEATCRARLITLVALLRSLGLRINWKKVLDPSTRVCHLGTEIDIVKGTLRLPQQISQLKDLLLQSLHKPRFSKTQLQRIAGKLNSQACIHRWGKAYSALIYHGIYLSKQLGHKYRFSKQMQKDFQWWIACLSNDLHIRRIWDQRPHVHITDSCQMGGGCFCIDDGDWTYVNFLLDKSYLANQHINIKELALISKAGTRFSPAYKGHQLCFKLTV